MKRKAIFLDKDGTLIPDIPYNANPDLISISNDAIAGLKELSKAGYLVVVITNQSGVARGYFGEDRLKAVFEKIASILSEEQIYVTAFYYCPHHPEATEKRYAVNCECRKPRPGMIIRAAEELNIDVSQSWMIGDILNDVEAGNRAGCKTILVDNGNETEWIISEKRKPYFIVKTLNEAACRIEEYRNQEYHETKLARL